ncbi:uncharacterized protein LOC141653085 [Silene latifolia]|uniref:uncharacterized protein LOC141653085 n=1 Tax=Silene latifolia TaxID=37657 RepID=UPI003D76DCEB
MKGLGKTVMLRHHAIFPLSRMRAPTSIDPLLVKRDRAAERRTFHKEFDEAMGDESSDEVAGSSECYEEAAAEALEMSLGPGSYAQKILKNMGWKEGEGLGKSQQRMTLLPVA